MIEESKYLSGVMKRHFNIELVMTREDKGNFKSSTKCCISENNYADKDVKGRDHCHIRFMLSGCICSCFPDETFKFHQLTFLSFIT